MDYNKIIILLVVILIVMGVGAFILSNQSNNNVSNTTVLNNTSSSVNADKINVEDTPVSDTSQSSSDESKYVSKEYAQEHMDEWNSGHGYYWVGDTQYDSATGKIIGGGSAEDQKALEEVYGDRL